VSARRFRKKPVVIDAVQIRGDNDNELLSWLNEHVVPFEFVGDHTLIIHTLEGDITAQPGDWIIRGVVGEFYPCKPYIFEATYEPVGEASVMVRQDASDFLVYMDEYLREIPDASPAELDLISEARRVVGNLAARLEAAEAALRKYGEHHEGCASWEGHEIAEPCNCGLHDALARVRGDKT